MIRCVGIEPRLQTNGVVLRVSGGSSNHRSKRRLLIHPVGRVHDQRALRRRHVNPPPTLLLLQSRHMSQSLVVNVVGVASETEGVVNSGSPASIHVVDRWSEGVERGEVHECALHGQGSIVGDLDVNQKRREDHVFSVQVTIGLNLQLLRVIVSNSRHVVVHRSLAVAREIPVGVVGHVHDRGDGIPTCFKHHIQIIGCGEGIGDPHNQSSRIAFFHVRRNSGEYHRDAVFRFVDRTIPKALAMTIANNAHFIVSLHTSMIVVISAIRRQFVMVCSKGELTMLNSERIPGC